VDSQSAGPFDQLRLGFFASTNLLLIAAVGGVLFGGDKALRGLRLGRRRGRADPAAGGQAGSGAALSGARPAGFHLVHPADELRPRPDRRGPRNPYRGGPCRPREAAARLLNPALGSFSQGVRGYYFALAAGAWLFGPVWLAAGVISAFALLAWRQAASPAARAIRTARRLLEANDET
jgi:uncharacterized membrane protein